MSSHILSHNTRILLVNDGELIETTPEHPFYVEGEGWVNAEDLRPGDRIIRVRQLVSNRKEVTLYLRRAG